MPHIMITEDDFENLSESSQKELKELLAKTFFKIDHYEDHKTDEGFESLVKKDTQWQVRRDSIRNNAKSYQQYLEGIKELQSTLPDLLDLTGQVAVDFISFELAISVLLGLNDESYKVLKKIVDRGMTSRDEIAAVLGDTKKINGTIGSINRRFRTRFDSDIYGTQRNRLKLVDFSKQFGKYSLTCPSNIFEHAISIIDAGYKIGSGNIRLTYVVDNYGATPKEHFQSEGTLVIEEEAIIFANDGKAFVERLNFSTDYVGEYQSISTRSGLTMPSANFVWQSGNGDEWFDDWEHWNEHSHNLHNNGYQITFGGPMP